MQLPNAYICINIMQALQGQHNELLDLVLQLSIRFSLNIITLIILLRYIYFTTYKKVSSFLHLLFLM